MQDYAGILFKYIISMCSQKLTHFIYLNQNKHAKNKNKTGKAGVYLGIYTGLLCIQEYIVDFWSNYHSPELFMNKMC